MGVGQLYAMWYRLKREENTKGVWSEISKREKKKTSTA